MDAGFTLTFCDGQAIAAVAASAGLRVSPEALEATEPDLRRELARFVWAATPSQQSEPARQGGAAFYRRLLELAAPTTASTLLDAAASAAWSAHLQRNLWRRVGVGVDAALGRLRVEGIKLAVVSNSEGTVEAMLNDVGLGRHIETVVDSWVVGIAKPDARIFQLALNRLNVAADEAIMIGDSPGADVDGARAAGIRAALIDPLNLHAGVGVPRFTDVPAFVDALLTRR